MSELTPCNFCNFRKMKNRNPHTDFRTIPNAEHGGVDIQERPKGVPEDYPWTPRNTWFMQLTDRCVC